MSKVTFKAFAVLMDDGKFMGNYKSEVVALFDFDLFKNAPDMFSAEDEYTAETYVGFNERIVPVNVTVEVADE